MLNRAHSAVCQLQHVRDIIQASDVNGSDSADSEEMAEKTWVVGIEKFMKGFSMGKTSTNSLFNLAQFNGIISYQSFVIFGSVPVLTHPATMRSAFGIRKSADCPDIKRAVYNFACTREPDHAREFPWKLMRNGELHKDNFDVTDAFLVACYTYQLNRVKHICSNGDLRSEFIAGLPGKRRSKKPADQIFEEAVEDWCFQGTRLDQPRGETPRGAMLWLDHD